MENEFSIKRDVFDGANALFAMHKKNKMKIV